MAETYAGGCHCGKTRFAVEGPVRHPCVCHCQSCRRTSGAPFVAWGTFPDARFRVTSGALAEYASSATARRGHCATCGTSLTYRHSNRADAVDIALAALDQPERIAPEFHIWVSEKLPWVQLGDGLPQYAGWRTQD